jgi:hypothetical protein
MNSFEVKSTDNKNNSTIDKVAGFADRMAESWVYQRGRLLGICALGLVTGIGIFNSCSEQNNKQPSVRPDTTVTLIVEQ